MANEQFTFKGYDILTWFKKNKDEIKIVINGVAALSAFFMTGGNAKAVAIAGAVYIGCKKVLDLIDYFCKE